MITDPDSFYPAVGDKLNTRSSGVKKKPQALKPTTEEELMRALFKPVE